MLQQQGYCNGSDRKGRVDRVTGGACVCTHWAKPAIQRDVPHGEEKTCFSAAQRDAVSLA